MTIARLIREQHLIGVAYILRGLIHYCHSAGYIVTHSQTWCLLHRDPTVAGSELSVTLSKTDLKTHPHSDILPLTRA